MFAFGNCVSQRLIYLYTYSWSLFQMGARIRALGLYLWQWQCNEPAKQCLRNHLLHLAAVTWWVFHVAVGQGSGPGLCKAHWDSWTALALYKFNLIRQWTKSVEISKVYWNMGVWIFFVEVCIFSKRASISLPTNITQMFCQHWCYLVHVLPKNSLVSNPLTLIQKVTA